MTHTVRLLRWQRRIEFRQDWRRAPYPGVAGLVLNLVMVASLAWLATHRDLLGPFAKAPVLLLTGTLARLILGIQQGAQALRRNLLAGRPLPLVYGAPQPPAHWLTASLVHGALKALSATLWVPLTIALLGQEPPLLRITLWAPAAFLAGAAAGAAGMVLGALAMVWLARRWPRDLSFVILLLQLVQLGAGLWVVLAAARGESPSLTARLLLGLPSLALGLPGLLLAVPALLGRLDLGRSCHETWLTLREHAGQSGPVRSVRLPLPAIAVRDLVALWRNPLGKYRTVMAGISLLAAPALGRWLVHQPESWLAAAPLLLWLAIPAEWIAAAFSGEGAALTWYRLAPVRPVRVMAAKWLALAMVPAVYAGTAAGALAVGAGRPVFALAFSTLAICLGAGTAHVGLAAFSATPATALGGEDKQLAAWAGEQIPRTTGGIAGYAAGTALLAAAHWHWLPWPALLVTPLAAMAAGLWRLHATWMPRRRYVQALAEGGKQ